MSDARQGDRVIPEFTLGWRLRRALEFAGMDAQEIANRLEVHRGTITRWTHDIGKPPRTIFLERWADLTGVPVEWLAGDRYRPDPTQGSPGVTARYRSSTLLPDPSHTVTRNRVADPIAA